VADCTYTAVLTAVGPNYTGTSTITYTINPEPVTFTGTPATFTYTGSPQGPTITPSVSGATYTTTGPLTSTAVGNYSITVTATGNYSGTGSVSYSIKCEPVTFTGSPLTFTYTGSPQGPTITPSVAGATYTVTSGSLTNTAQGTYTVVLTAVGPNFMGSSTITYTISPKAVTFAGSPLTFTYNGSAQGPTITPSVAGATYTVTTGSLTNTAAGTYTAVLTAVGPNYTGTSTISYTISPKAVTFTGSPLSFTYTGSPQGPTITPSVAGATYTVTSGSLTNTVTGSYTAVLTAVGPNYTGTSTISYTINPKAVTFTGAPTTFTYNGSAQGPTITPSVSGATYTTTGPLTSTAAGTYSIAVTATGNYTGTGAVSYTINAEPVTFTGSPLTFTYNGSAQGPTITVSPANATYTTTGTATATAVGSYTETLTATGNYTGTKTISWTITPAAQSTVTISPVTQTITVGASITFTASGGSGTGAYVWGGSSGATSSAVTFSTPGIFTVTVYKAADANYSVSNTATATITVNKATATITLPTTTATYTGSPIGLTATTGPAGLAVTYSYTGTGGTTYGPTSTPPTGVGTYSVTATINNPNYNSTSATATLTITKATPVLAWATPASITYGTLLSSTQLDPTSSVPGTFVYSPAAGAKLPVGTGETLTATFTPTDTKDYVSGGTVTTTITVTKAAATITLPTTTVTYTGSPVPVTATTGPAGLAVTYTYAGTGGTTYGPSSTPPTNAGSYSVTATINDPSYTGTVTAALTIAKAPATVNLANSIQYYTGSSITVTGTTVPANLKVTYSYTGTGSTVYGPSATGPTNVGTYSVTETVTDPNYYGSATATLTIETKECLVWLQGNCGDHTDCDDGKGYNGRGGYSNFGDYCSSGGYNSSSATQFVCGGSVVPIAFAVYNCNSNNGWGGNYGTGCNGNFVTDTSIVISISEEAANGTLSDPVIYGYSATGPNPPNYWILKNEYLLNFPTAAGTHHYSIEVYRPQPDGTLQQLGSQDLYTSSSCLPNSCSSSGKFNTTTIAKGDSIWFTSIVNVGCDSTKTSALVYDSSTITFKANGSSVTVNVPAGSIQFSPTATSATTTYNGSTNSWVTIVPSSYTGNVFLTGVAYPVTAAITGGISSVSWSGTCRSDSGSLTAKWQWSAAVYTQFAADASLGVKPVDSSTLSQYKNSDHAGTPENYKQYLTAGACGTGGSNYTGTYGSASSPQVGNSGCWLDSTSFQGGGWWGNWGWDGTWANSITGGGGWGNGGSGGNSCGNGGDGNADGGWGSGWDNGNSNFGYGNW
jgi:PKD repeat protein